MTQEQATLENPAEQPALATPMGEPLLPDGIGLSLEQAQALMSKAHKIVLANDEPALLTVTIFNAYLGEMAKLQARHEKGLTRLMAEKTDAYVSGVKAATDQLAESLSSASVEGIRKIFDDHAARLNSFKSNVHLATLIVGLSALLNVAVFILRAVR